MLETGDEIIVSMVGKFVACYDKVDSIEDSDFISTDDLYSEFQRFYPGYYSTDELVALLVPAFKFEWSPELKKFIWLIKA